MLKWLIVFVLAALVAGLLQSRLPPGRLPGDLRLRLRGRDYLFPFASALLFSALAWLIGRLL